MKHEGLIPYKHDVSTCAYLSHSRPQWSRGNVLASRSKVHGLNPDLGDGFFQDVKILSTSPPGGTLS